MFESPNPTIFPLSQIWRLLWSEGQPKSNQLQDPQTEAH